MNINKNSLALIHYFCLKPVFWCLIATFLLGMLQSHAWGEGVKNHRFSALALAPYGFIESNKQQGIYADILREAVRRSNLKASVDVVPAKRLLTQIKHGEISCSILFKVDHFEEWLEPVAKVGKSLDSVIFFQKGMKIESLTDLEEYSLGVVNGIRLSPKISENENIQKRYVNNYKQGVRMLNAKRFDALVGTRSALMHSFLIQKINMSNFPDPFVFNRNNLYLMCRKGNLSETEKNALRLSFEQMRKNGFIETAWATYLNGGS